MSDRPISSLDRFVVRSAPVLAALTGEAIAGSILRTIGGLYVIAGGGMLAAAAWGALAGTAVVNAIFPGAILLLTSVILAGARRVHHNYVDRMHMSRSRLSPEARDLLHTLSTYLSGWPFGIGFQKLRQIRRMTGQTLLRMIRDRRTEDALSPQGFAVLEPAAQAYNRICGVLDDNMSQNSALRQWSSGIQSASDEAISHVLHLVAHAECHPENAAMFQGDASPYTDALEKLASTVERLRSTPELTESLPAANSQIDALLREIRDDQAARLEIELIHSPAVVSDSNSIPVAPGAEDQPLNLSR